MKTRRWSADQVERKDVHRRSTASCSILAVLRAAGLRVSSEGIGVPLEFARWNWQDPDCVIAQGGPSKREVYERVMAAFQGYLG